MATLIDYALMAGASYISTRSGINTFPIPKGWANTRHANPQDGSGFEAISFLNGSTIATSTEIVISYAGTYDRDIAGDIVADAGLAAGTGSAQLLQAVEYYLQVNAANPAATIRAAAARSILREGLSKVRLVEMCEERVLYKGYWILPNDPVARTIIDQRKN